MKYFVYSILSIAAMILIAILLFTNVIMSTMNRVEWQEEVYIVEDGDSLWGISYDYCPDNVDRRDWIDEVQKLNDLDGSLIYPGQRLTVLAPAD